MEPASAKPKAFDSFCVGSSVNMIGIKIPSRQNLVCEMRHIFMKLVRISKIKNWGTSSAKDFQFFKLYQKLNSFL
jgi:hypothetical protein